MNTFRSSAIELTVDLMIKMAHDGTVGCRVAKAVTVHMERCSDLSFVGLRI